MGDYSFDFFTQPLVPSATVGAPDCYAGSRALGGCSTLVLPTSNLIDISSFREEERVEPDAVLAPEQDKEEFFTATTGFFEAGPRSAAPAAQAPSSDEEEEQQSDSTTHQEVFGRVSPHGCECPSVSLPNYASEASLDHGHGPESEAQMEEEELQTSQVTITRWLSILSDDDAQEEEQESPWPSPSAVRIKARSCAPSLKEIHRVLGLPALPLPSEPTPATTSISPLTRGTHQLADARGPESSPVQKKHTSPKDVSAGGEPGGPEFRCPAPRPSLSRLSSLSADEWASAQHMQAGNEQGAGSAAEAVPGGMAEAPAVTRQAQARPALEPQEPSRAAAAAATGEDGAASNVDVPRPYADKRSKLQPPDRSSPPPTVATQPKGQGAEGERPSQSPGGTVSIFAFPTGAGGQKESHVLQARHAHRRIRDSLHIQPISPGTGIRGQNQNRDGAAGASSKGPDAASVHKSTIEQPLPGLGASGSGEEPWDHSATTGADTGSVALAANGELSGGFCKSPAISHLPITSLLGGSSMGRKDAAMTPSGWPDESGSTGRRPGSGTSPKGMSLASVSPAPLGHLTGTATLLRALASPASGGEEDTFSIPGKSTNSVGTPPPVTTRLPQGTGRQGVPEDTPAAAGNPVAVSRAAIRICHSPAGAAQVQSPLTLQPPSPVTELRAKLMVASAALAPRPFSFPGLTKKHTHGSDKSGQKEAPVREEQGPMSRTEGAAAAGRKAGASQACCTPTVPTNTEHAGIGESAQKRAEWLGVVKGAEVASVPGQPTEAAAAAPEPCMAEAGPAPNVPSVEGLQATTPLTAEAATVARPSNTSAKGTTTSVASPQRDAEAAPTDDVSLQEGPAGHAKPKARTTSGERVPGGHGLEQAGAGRAGSLAGAAPSGGKHLGSGKRKRSGQVTEPPGERIVWDSLLGIPLVSRGKKRPTPGPTARPANCEAGRGDADTSRGSPDMGPSVVAPVAAKCKTQGPAVLGKQKKLSATGAPGADTVPTEVGQSGAQGLSQGPAVLGKPNKITARGAPGACTAQQPAQFLTPQGKDKRAGEHALTPTATSESQRRRKTCKDYSTPLTALRSRLPPNRRHLHEEDLDLWDLAIMYM